MIVYPASFVASADVSLRNSRIGYHTYTREAAAVVSASSETDDGPKDAPQRPDTAEFWLASSDPATWTLDIGSQQPVDYVGIAGHELGSNNALVAVHVSTDGVAWQSFSSDLMPSDDSPIMFLDEQVICRYVRLTFTSGVSPSTPSRIAVIYVGVALAMQRTIYGGHRPLSLSRNTVLHRSMSQGGQFLGQGIRRMGVGTSVAFRHLTPSWYRSSFDPFVKAARRFPYFFAWRPLSYPREVGFVWTGKDISPQNMGVLDFMQVSWDMSGIGYSE